MKIILIATVVAYVTLTSGVRVQHQDVDVGQLLPVLPTVGFQQRQNVGQQNLGQGQTGQTLGVSEGQTSGQTAGQTFGQTGDQQQLHQCTCENQYKGINEFKDFFSICSNQCRISQVNELKSLIDHPIKLYSCIDQKVELVHHLFDCVNSQLIQQDSCVTDTQVGQGQMLKQQDFRQMFINSIQPLVDEISSTYENIDPNFMDKYGPIFLDNCSRTCVFDKIQTSPFWEKINCLPKIDENKITQLLQQCYRDVNYKQMIQQICKCSVGVGVKDLQPYCQQLRTVQFPQWFQSQQNEQDQQGMMGDQQGSADWSGQLGHILAQSGQFGQTGQIGQSGFGQLGKIGQYILGPKLLVKLAIQQEQPIPVGLVIGGLGQGQSQGQGGVSKQGQSQSLGGRTQGQGGGSESDQGQTQDQFGGSNQGVSQGQGGGVHQGVSQGQGGGLGSRNYQSGLDTTSFL